MEPSPHLATRAPEPRADARSERALRRRLLVRGAFGVALFAAFAVVAVWAARGGVTVDTLRARIGALGPWAKAGYVLAFGLLQPLGPPGHLFVLTAGVLWPKPAAFACAMAGALLAQALSIGVYRSFLRAWAERRLPVRFRRYEAWLLRHPVLGVTCVRLLTFTGQLAALGLALSRVPVAALCLGTVLGLLPGIVIDIWLIDEIRAFWSWLIAT